MTPAGARRGRLAQLALSVALGLALAAGCRGIAGEQGEQSPAAQETSSPVLAVTVAKVRASPMREELKLLGTTAATRHVILRAPVAGRVLGMKLKVGDVVKRGQLVAHVMSREVEAAEQGLEIARKMDPEEAGALARSVKRYATAPGLPVTAPERGVVAQPPVTSGQMVNYLDPLVDLIDPASIYVDAAVPVDDLHLVKPGLEAIVTSQIEPGAELPARVAALLPSFNPASATSSVRLEFTSSGRISETGAPVEIRIITRSVAAATVIPQAALFEDPDGGFHVFVLGRDGRAHRIAVTPGIRASGKIQVTSGLRPGQTVITSGGYALSDGLGVTAAGGQD